MVPAHCRSCHAPRRMPNLAVGFLAANFVKRAAPGDPKRPVARDPCSHSLVDGLRLVAKRTSARGLPSMVMHMMRIGHVRMHMPQRLVLMPMAVFAYGHRLVIMVVMTVVVSMGVLML